MRIELRLAGSADWIKVFDPRDGTIFVAGENPPPVGTDLRVDLTCGEGGPRVILRGQVIGHRTATPHGCMVALARSEREKVNYLNGFVRGGLLNLRANRRVPVRLPTTYTGRDGSHDSYTRDINEQGVFIVSSAPLPEGSEVRLLIRIPRRPQSLAVRGMVTHTVVLEDEDIPGMGIVFQMAESERGIMVAAVDALEQEFLTGSLPEEVLA